MAYPGKHMDGPVNDSDRLEAIFEQVRSIRTIVLVWSIILGIALAVSIVSMLFLAV